MHTEQHARSDRVFLHQRACLVVPSFLALLFIDFLTLCFFVVSLTPPPLPLAPTLSRSLFQDGMAACRWLTPSPFTRHSRCTVLVAVFPPFVGLCFSRPAAAFFTVVTLPTAVFPCCRLPHCMRLNLVLPPFDAHRFPVSLSPTLTLSFVLIFFQTALGLLRFGMSLSTADFPITLAQGGIGFALLFSQIQRLFVFSILFHRSMFQYLIASSRGHFHVISFLDFIFVLP